jgi:hypothetical protein
MKTTIVLPEIGDGCNRLVIEPDPKHRGQVRLNVLGLPFVISFPVEFAGAVSQAIEAAAFTIEETVLPPELPAHALQAARDFAAGMLELPL